MVWYGMVVMDGFIYLAREESEFAEFRISGEWLVLGLRETRCVTHTYIRKNRNPGSLVAGLFAGRKDQVLVPPLHSGQAA